MGHDKSRGPFCDAPCGPPISIATHSCVFPFSVSAMTQRVCRGPVVLVSCSPSVPAFTFSYTHIPRQEKGQGGFHGFQCPFAFAFVSAGHQQSRETGGGVEGVCWCVYAVFAVLVLLADLGELTGYSQ